MELVLVSVPDLEMNPAAGIHLIHYNGVTKQVNQVDNEVTCRSCGHDNRSLNKLQVDVKLN